MAATFRWCFIGAGTLAKNVLKELKRTDAHRIVSVYTRDPQKCAKFAEACGAAACATAEEAINREDVDGVYVVTPHTTHYQYAKLALELGKPVLCEKPLTINAGDSKELIRIAREKNLYFTEAMWTWFAAVPNQLKAWLDAGEFGTVTDVEVKCHVFAVGYAPRVTDPAVGGGALLDMGVYPITYLYRLFGKPVSVRCTGVIEKGIDWDDTISLTFEDGTVRVIDLSIRKIAGTPWIKIKGTKASVTVKPLHTAEKMTLERADGTRETFEGAGDYLNEFNLVADEIRAGLTESRYEPHQVTIDVMEIIDECRRQIGLVYPFEK